VTPPRILVLTVDREIKCFNETAAHLDSMGVKWERFNGFDNRVLKLNPVETFDLDRAGSRIAPKHIAATLTHWAAWKVMEYQPDDSFWVLEYDVRLPHDWKDTYQLAMAHLPEDWDIFFLGSCCCKGRNTSLIGGNVYKVEYPLCGHAIMYRKKALPTLLKNHQKINMPLDIALFYMTLPHLNVYTALPPIIVQAGAPLPP
jgi:GR25 family glycosyltransferase involved in LPS biosynthesis